MAKKLIIDSAITADLKAAASDSFADNIKMIDIKSIMPNKQNFYELNDIELLAADIERQGLKHNLVVVKDADSAGYWLISGHRRLEAVKLLIKEGRLKSTLLPCYVNGEKSMTESKLDLIMLNATQRKYSDAEMMSEYENLSKTLIELEHEGKKQVGNTRDKIAEILNISNGQVGKMEAISNKGVDELKNAVKSGDMSINTANEVARLAPDEQREIVENCPDIKYADVKAKQKAATAPKDSPNAAESKPAPKAAKPQEGLSPPPQKKSVMFTERELKVLLKYIDDLILSCGNDADELALHVIKERLEGAAKS